MSMKTTVSNPTHPKRYTDMNYPGNRFDIQDQPTYYEVSYSGVARQHDKYQVLKRAVLAGIEHVLSTGTIETVALSSQARELRDWALGSVYGFTCEHMPWRILVPHDLYRIFIYVLRAEDSESGNAAYSSIRRYGRWV